MLDLFKNIFNKDKKILKKYQNIVNKINEKEEKYMKMNDDEIKSKYNKIKEEVVKKVNEIDKKYNLKEIVNFNEYVKTKELIKLEYNKILNKYLVDIFAMVREAAKRTLKMRHFDVQLMGGIAIHEGKIAEMKTGEGKTFVATLPSILNSLIKKPIHIVTVNDYLAKRDSNLMKPLYEYFNLSVGYVTSEVKEKRKEYNKDIVYVTNSELVFDYLKDNLAYSLEEQNLQNNLFYAIIDEIDSILIDEARTPLIISGLENQETHEKLLPYYIKSDEFVRLLKVDEDYIIDEKNNNVYLTEKGLEKEEKFFNIKIYEDSQNHFISRLVNNALRAHTLLKNGRNYIVRKNKNNEDEIFLIDEYTGRIAEGKTFSGGLHQAIQAKEGVKITPEVLTEAEITYQMFFKLYIKLAGMTGTAKEEEEEFFNIYNLKVLSIPTNKPVIRKDYPDRFFTTKEAKLKAIIEKIEELYKKGQPVLIGTTNVNESELISKKLKEKNIQHNVLNAKNHEKEAEIIAEAGKKGAITVATNMAGRGTDIKIDEEVKKLGGLFVLGTERYEDRRIDNQLIGRSGRQGDPGESQFFISLDDDLIKIFSGDSKMINFLKKQNLDEIGESKYVSKLVKKGQEKIKSMKYEIRKNILSYDEIINTQRNVIYSIRQKIIEKKYNLDKKKIDEWFTLYLDDIEQKIYQYTNEIRNNEEFQSFILKLKNQLQKNNIDKNDEEIEYLIFKYFIYKDFNIIIDLLDYSDIEDFKNKIKEIFLELIEEELKNEELKDFLTNYLLLSIIDEEWKKHLTVMDILKEGIHLRSFSQKDPLIEYKKEAFELFGELLKNIKIKFLKKMVFFLLNNEETNSTENFKFNKNESKDIKLNEKNENQKNLLKKNIIYLLDFELDFEENLNNIMTTNENKKLLNQNIVFLLKDLENTKENNSKIYDINKQDLINENIINLLTK